MRSRRVCRFMLCFAACVVGWGCSKSGGPVDGGQADQAVTDTSADETAMDAPADEGWIQPDAGGQGAPCRTGADCAQYYQCVVLAAATACPSTPIGYCSYYPPGNCSVSSYRCDCFKHGPMQPDCSPFPNTICDVASGEDGGKCATCVPVSVTP